MERSVRDRWDTVFAEGRDFTVLNEFLLQEVLKEVARRGITQKRVLDLGCGTGQSSLLFARYGCTVSAVDISSVALEKARARATAEAVGDPNLHFVEADLENLTDTTLSGDFDLIHLKLVLAFIKNKDGLLAYSAEHLAQPGMAIITSPVLKEGIEYSDRLIGISLSEAELEGLLKAHFTDVTLFHREFFEERGLAHTYLASGRKTP